MPAKLKPARSPLRHPGASEDGAPKVRSKMLGLGVAGDGHSSPANERDESGGDTQDQKEHLAQMEQELARRQESYVRRERQYKVRLAELEAQLNETRAKKTKENSVDATMDKLRTMHRAIIENVDHVQDRTSKILQDQEKDLLRAFRARLYSVQEELESEKNKTDDGASAWIEKSKQLETEVEWTKELADRLDRLNQSLTRENQRLKTQFTTQENDREFLVKQLVVVKKDNVRLRSECESLQQQLEELKDDTGRSSGSLSSTTAASASMGALPRVMTREASSRMVLSSRPTTATGIVATAASGGLGFMSSAAALEADNRYKEIIKRLKRVLDVERRNLQQVRSAYKSELQNRTELEMILKECIHDVRGEIATASTAMASPTAVVMPAIHNGVVAGSSRRLESSGSMATLVSDHHMRLNAVERQRLIEKLLAKERLLNLLTTKAFPIKNGKPPSDPLLTGDAVSAEEIAKIYAEVASLTATTSAPGETLSDHSVRLT